MAFTLKVRGGERQVGNRGEAVFSCDYNGWADMPEAEREAIDAFELAEQLPPVRAALRELPRPPVTPVRWIPQQRAA